jgi:hypothetical protein
MIHSAPIARPASGQGRRVTAYPMAQAMARMMSSASTGEL